MRLYVWWVDQVVLRIVVLQVQAARSPSLLVVVSADILHCTVLVAAAVVAGHTLHSLVVVKVLPEEVGTLNNLAADIHFVEDIPVVVVRSLVEEGARSLEEGELHSLEAGIVAVVDSHVAAPGRGRRT